MKQGRNDPCSCGSGKKHKNCCLGKESVFAASQPTSFELSQLDALFAAGRYAELEHYARVLLERYPSAGAIWKLLALALQMQGKDALYSMQKAVELLPQDAEAHANLAAVLRALGRFEESITIGRKAVQLKPNLAEAHNNLGVAQKELWQFNDAAASFRRAVQIKPAFSQAHFNLANTLKELGLVDDALASYKRALALQPNFSDAFSNLLLLLNYSSGKSSVTALEEARQYGRMLAQQVAAKFTSWQCSSQPERLRVGLVSGDLRAHPVGYFLESLLAHIDQSRIELFAYPTCADADALTARIKPYFSAWNPVYGLRDDTAARLIHADGIHILIDLSGHTTHNRLPVFAWKPAPVQVSWLGYFATTGVAEMDFLLADAVGVPEQQRAHFTETVCYLPDTRLCFTPPSVDIPVATLPALNNGYVTFGCFQYMTKATDEVLAAWSKILAALPTARLRWQCKQFSDATVLEQIKQRLLKHQIDPARVSLHGVVSRDAYLAAHNEVDLLLDTFPYPGGTTTCEALWMGVPTVTLAGETLLARQGASLLAAAGLQDWIASDSEDYIAKAVAFSSNLAALASLRMGLRTQVLASPLFDASKFAANFQQVLWQLWESNGIQ